MKYICYYVNSSVRTIRRLLMVSNNKRVWACIHIQNIYLTTWSFISQWKKLLLVEGFIQGLFSTTIFLQRFSFYTVCLVNYLFHGWHQRGNFRSLGLQIVGNCICDTFFDCRGIACTLFVFRGGKFYWNFRVSWGVLWDWVS